VAEKRSQGSWIASLNLGTVSSDHLKSIAYCAADLFIFPTRADNLSNAEYGLAICADGLFQSWWRPDLVRPGITGCLAAPEDVKDFCNGIVQLWKIKICDRTWVNNVAQSPLMNTPTTTG